jgi:hypothetical protein
MMPASKDSSGLCCKSFYGEQKILSVCGPCASRFRLSCLQASETEYNYEYYVDI